MQHILPEYSRIKGIHPGAILKRELKKRNLKAIDLAKSINEHPQTINAITKEKRGINPKLSFKLGIYFDVNEDYFMLLQASFEVARFKKKHISERNPLIGKFRDSIFWDTKIEFIDHEKNRRSIIKRVLERGNQSEIEELIKLYSLKTIRNELKEINGSFIPNFEKNLDKYIYSVL